MATTTNNNKKKKKKKSQKLRSGTKRLEKWKELIRSIFICAYTLRETTGSTLGYFNLHSQLRLISLDICNPSGNSIVKEIAVIKSSK